MTCATARPRSPEDEGNDPDFPTARSSPDTHAVTMVNNVIAVLNSVIAARPSLLNYVIADT